MRKMRIHKVSWRGLGLGERVSESVSECVSV